MIDFHDDQGRRRKGGRRSAPGRWRAEPTDGGERAWGAGRGRGRDRGRHDDFGWYGGHGFGGGPGFGGGGRRGRKAGRGDVRAAILALLAEEPMHGYQIMNEITDRSGGMWHPSPGSVYPTLQALEDEGLVVATTAEGRRVFQLTDEGREAARALGERPAPWEVASRHGDRSTRDLRRLVGDVAQATAQTVRTGSPDQLESVRDLLAETRRRIYLVLAEGPGATEPAPTNEPAPTVGE